ncbi:calcineurin-like phosphoesterase C-terminal domain-containing protein [Coralloluteibacterium stylophorae]|uniref:Calcineurin-like phosphoesterase family protein n=1 Tax=Coralloluteibacterium stylophorae TaxID=1776034 RepID=A0A8J8AXY5_9GAMM|nr:calcineurin-like phosphoesterase family protein [Coralloluteibacterium stylophorae]MBS7455882.1 calcineurin-like phosphoesterase family protein [Coralloluteibacterium stylophorae]
MRRLVPFALILAAPSLHAATLSGRVHDGGVGVADVQVSNGRDIVPTDAAGRFALEAGQGDTVFVIKPPRCSLPAGDDGLPAFWRHGGIAPRPGDAGAWDFALDCADAPGPGPFDVLVFGDTQVAREADVGHYATDVVEPIRTGAVPGRDARFGITLGDVVDDDLSLYPAINAVTTRLGMPWLHVPGNHDMDLDAADDAHALTGFRRTYGPDTYAWEEGNARVVVLDDVLAHPGQRPAYHGGLREDQFAFMERYLGGIDPDNLVVLAMHIPLYPRDRHDDFDPVQRERLYRLLERFPHVLVLTAHSHTQQHWFHAEQQGWRGARPLHEYNVGAVCGAFWSGVPDARGVPDATMADGTPNGHALMRVGADAGYALRYYAAGAPPEQGIALHAPKVLRRGAWPGVGIHANVFMGIDGDRVEMRIDGGEWMPMTRVDAPDPRLVAVNVADDAAAALRGFDRAPQAETSAHLWRGGLPTDLAAGTHEVEVRAFDRWRGELRATTQYRLEDAAP